MADRGHLNASCSDHCEAACTRCKRGCRLPFIFSVCDLQNYVRRKHQDIPIEVETQTLDEVKEVLDFLETDKHTLVRRLMLDNMTKVDASAAGMQRTLRWSCT